VSIGTVLTLTELEWRAREEAVGRWGASCAAAVKNGWLGASLRGYGDGGGGASSLQRCGEEERPRQRENGVQLSAGGRWRDEGALGRVVACAVRALATRGHGNLHAARDV